MKLASRLKVELLSRDMPKTPQLFYDLVYSMDKYAEVVAANLNELRISFSDGSKICIHAEDGTLH